MVKDIAFVAYSVRDVPAATTFYRDQIGLTPGDTFGEHWAEFNVGPATFGIGNGEKIGMKPGTSHGAAFEVDDLAGMRSKLLGAGVKVGDVNESPVCFSSFVTDPEGNVFALHQRKP
jgi:predicted enzyme related to lactoylglutathione lyase